jgi:hypothetical protein
MGFAQAEALVIVGEEAPRIPYRGSMCKTHLTTYGDRGLLVHDGSDPPTDSGGGQGEEGITRGQHARLRFGQGRPIANVVNDVQGAGLHEVFVQVDDGRWVIRGPRGREHIIEATVQYVTSLRRPVAYQARLQDGKIRPATEDEFRKLKASVE